MKKLFLAFLLLASPHSESSRCSGHRARGRSRGRKGLLGRPANTLQELPRPPSPGRIRPRSRRSRIERRRGPPRGAPAVGDHACLRREPAERETDCRFDGVFCLTAEGGRARQVEDRGSRRSCARAGSDDQYGLRPVPRPDIRRTTRESGRGERGLRLFREPRL